MLELLELDSLPKNKSLHKSCYSVVKILIVVSRIAAEYINISPTSLPFGDFAA